MVKISKDLYEISHLEISSRLSEMTTFLSQTKSFSVKVNSHIKIMANLINTLIESEDSLELTEKELKAASHQNGKRSEPVQPSPSTNPSTEQKLIDRLISNFQNENDKLWGFVQKGEQNTEFLKTCFDKLLDNMSQRDKGSVINDPPHHQDNVNNINTYPYLPDHGRNPNVSVHLPNNRPTSPYRYTHGTEKGQDPRFDPNRFYSVYEVKNPRQSERKDGLDEEETIKSLKDEVGRMTKELKMIRKEKNNEESGLQEIVKKLIEIKTESEDIIRQKDRKIDELLANLHDANNKMIILENEVSFLKENNKMLEQTVNDIFKAQKKVMDFNDYNYDVPRHEDQRLIEELRDANVELKKKIKRLEMDLNEKDHKKDQDGYYKLQSGNLQSKIRELEQKNIDLEEKNNQLCNLIENKISTTTTTKTKSMTSDEYDLLKCIYVQGCYLEDFIGFNPHMSLFNHEA